MKITTNKRSLASLLALIVLSMQHALPYLPPVYTCEGTEHLTSSIDALRTAIKYFEPINIDDETATLLCNADYTTYFPYRYRYVQHLVSPLNGLLTFTQRIPISPHDTIVEYTFFKAQGLVEGVRELHLFLNEQSISQLPDELYRQLEQLRDDLVVEIELQINSYSQNQDVALFRLTDRDLDYIKMTTDLPYHRQSDIPSLKNALDYIARGLTIADTYYAAVFGDACVVTQRHRDAFTLLKRRAVLCGVQVQGYIGEMGSRRVRRPLDFSEGDTNPDYESESDTSHSEEEESISS